MSFVLRIVNDPARYESLDSSAWCAKRAVAFLLSVLPITFVWSRFHFFCSRFLMNERWICERLPWRRKFTNSFLSLVRPCEMMRWRMILSPDKNDVNMSEKLEKNKTDCEWMTENDVKWPNVESDEIRKKKKKICHEGTSYSLVTDKKSPGSSNVEYLYFQIYTHNTRTYNTMTDEVMDSEMSEWVWAWWRW